jgi:hypothetical protein
MFIGHSLPEPSASSCNKCARKCNSSFDLQRAGKTPKKRHSTEPTLLWVCKRFTEGKSLRRRQVRTSPRTGPDRHRPAGVPGGVAGGRVAAAVLGAAVGRREVQAVRRGRGSPSPGPRRRPLLFVEEPDQHVRRPGSDPCPRGSPGLEGPAVEDLQASRQGVLVPFEEVVLDEGASVPGVRDGPDDSSEQHLVPPGSRVWK